MVNKVAEKWVDGRYIFPDSGANPEFTLSVEHVQADAYAPPSRFRALIPLARTLFPEKTFSTQTRFVTTNIASFRTCADS